MIGVVKLCVDVQLLVRAFLIIAVGRVLTRVVLVRSMQREFPVALVLASKAAMWTRTSSRLGNSSRSSARSTIMSRNVRGHPRVGGG